MNHTHDNSIIHPTYLPFSVEQLQKHFVDVDGRPDKYVRYYLDSIARYEDFCRENPERKGLSLTAMRRPAQVEKDERFWIVACLMLIFYSADPVASFTRVFQTVLGDKPPMAGIEKWEECFDGDLKLFFEVQLPAPPAYKEWLRENIMNRHMIPYVFDAAHNKNGSAIKKTLEGPTHVDAVLLNADNGFAALFEAKVLSDISYQVSFDATRNQIARNIDVMLERNDGLHHPLDKRDPDRTCFLLLTPELFREKWQSRLYGWLMKEYQIKPEALARDIGHRNGVDWSEVAGRLGWLTWEDCQRILPGACSWI